jgi:hypothetical protein
MPISPKNELAERAHLARRVEQMQLEIETLKTKLSDNSQLDALMARVTNCESLAGIPSHNPPSVKGE